MDYSNKRFYPWFVCLLGALFYCYEYFLRIAPSVMSSQLMHTFNISASELGLLAAFYYYAYTPSQIAVGVLMDRYGPHKLLTIATLFCALGSYVFASTSLLWVADVGRLLIGFGSAFAFVGTLKLATIWLPPSRFGLVSGLATALGMAGAIYGDLALTSFVEQVGWKQAIIYSSFVGLGLALFIFLCIREKNNSDQEDGESVPPIEISKLVGSFWDMLKSRDMWLAGIIGCLVFIPITGFAEMWGPAYIQSAYQVDKMTASALNSMVFLGFGLGCPIVGWISDHIKRRRPPIIFGSIGAACMAVIILYIPNLNISILYVALFLFGVFSSAEVLVFAIGRELSDRNAAGTAIAFMNMLIMVGGMIFPHVIGLFLDFTWSGGMLDGIRVYSILNYQSALCIIPVSLLMASVLIRFIRETFCQLR